MQDFDPICYIESKRSRSSYVVEDADYLNKQNNMYPYVSVGGFFPSIGIVEKKIPVPYKSFSILGEIFIVPTHFNDIIEEIIDSQDVLKLEKNWDMNGADVITQSIYLEAVKLLLLYSIHIYKEFNIVIKAPEINPCRNGSIDLSWRTNGARMLINVREKDNEFRAAFHGYHKSNNLPFEGLIDMKKVDKVMAIWMKELK